MAHQFPLLCLHVDRYDTLEIISFAWAFFEGHHELLTGFNILLPRGYSIDSVVPEMDLPEKLRDIVDSVTAMHRVKVWMIYELNNKTIYSFYAPNLSQCFLIADPVAE